MYKPGKANGIITYSSLLKYEFIWSETRIMSKRG